MQNDIDAFETELKAALQWTWTKPAEEQEETPADTWASRMANLEKNKQTNPIDNVPMPEIDSGKDWRIKLLDLER